MEQKSLLSIRIDNEKTGIRIKNLMAENGYSVKELQELLLLGSPQAVYKWLYGTIPRVEHLMRLSELFHMPINDILIVEKDEKIHSSK